MEQQLNQDCFMKVLAEVKQKWTFFCWRLLKIQPDFKPVAKHAKKNGARRIPILQSTKPTLYPNILLQQLQAWPIARTSPESKIVLLDCIQSTATEIHLRCYRATAL